MEKIIKGVYAIIDMVGRTDRTASEIALSCLKGGVRLLQLREKNADPQKRFDQAQKILSFKKNHDFIFIINDDPEMAIKLGADGVHVGQEDMSVADAQKIGGPNRIIGKSTHSWEEAKKAQREDINYFACGAIFPTQAKGPEHPILGTHFLTKIVQTAVLPVVAIGGINRSNFDQVLQTGVHAVAIMSALNQAENPEEEARFFVERFKNRTLLKSNVKPCYF